VVLGAGVVVGLTACASGGPGFSPKPIETVTPAVPPKTSPGTASASTTPSTSPSSTPTQPAVKATGSMALFGTVTKALSGTCRTVDGAPTIKLSDHSNEFYGTVDATLVLKPGKAAITSVDAAFGEDTEGFTWKLSYSAASPAAGTSAKLVGSGNTYTVSGKLKAEETRKGKTIEEVLPFKVVAKCAGAEW
jgi:hypothetical protein